LCFCVLAGVLAATAAGGTQPKVVLVDTSPVMVTGTGFDRSAPVRVTVTSGDQELSKTVMSTAAGSFSARWSTALHPAGCAQRVLTARSAHHTVAVKSMPSAVACGAQHVTP
jgi:hypothetical protein